MIGGRFGKLVVLARAENYKTQRQWLCQCDCGKTAVVRTGHLTSEAVKSCGCGRGRFVHGLSYTSERVIWSNMKQRCHNPKHPNYHLYGGRGIEVCERRRESFVAFIDDMGRRPDPKAEVDRKDGDGPYSPDNCRWATRREQCNNLRSNVRLTMGGVTRTRQQWADQFGISVETLRYRLARGEDLKSALTRPPKQMRGRNC